MMDDLISRQAVINVLDKNHILGRGDLNEVLDHIVDRLEKLPSAQPEIVRCKDCIFHGLCRTSPKWAVAPKDDWYCADAERSTDERSD